MLHIFRLGFRSVVVITSALHAEGRQFNPGRKQFFFFNWKRLYHVNITFFITDLLYCFSRGANLRKTTTTISFFLFIRIIQLFQWISNHYTFRGLFCPKLKRLLLFFHFFNLETATFHNVSIFKQFVLFHF